MGNGKDAVRGFRLTPAAYAILRRTGRRLAGAVGLSQGLRGVPHPTCRNEITETPRPHSQPAPRSRASRYASRVGAASEPC
jgi:hypothetical protein